MWKLKNGRQIVIYNYISKMTNTKPNLITTNILFIIVHSATATGVKKRHLSRLLSYIFKVRMTVEIGRYRRNQNKIHRDRSIRFSTKKAQ